MKLIKPTKLQAGDKVAAITLSWGGAATFPDRYALGKKRLEENFGVQVVLTRHALREAAWIAANPKARADDLMEAFADPQVKAIFSIIGGEDSIRLLPYVDLNVIARHPKIFMGMSDTTVTHFMCLKAGLSSFYGPSILADMDENVEAFPYMLDSVRRTLFTSEPLGEIAPSDEWTGEMLPWQVPENAKIKRKRHKPLGYQVLQGSGVVRGPLIGGCIEVLDWLRGTAVWPVPQQWEGAILFLETSEENPTLNQFTRMVRCFAAMGILNCVNGILLGRPMVDPDPALMTQYDVALQKVVRDECGLADLPIMTQLDFGHSAPQMVLPYGAEAEIDCERKAFSILESGVSAAPAP
ncbi:MAG: S66 peptidase family protein [Bdellovibrionales bacterium]|jgi:muramoyltetrapeptide carboxypeptidase LdcA involved in peptidoglycan recycling